MATYNVKSTGTKNSGASVVGDFGDTNCYPTLSAALTEAGAGDHTFVLADNTTITETGRIGADFDDLWTGEKVVKSAGGDPTSSIITTDFVADDFMKLQGASGAASLRTTFQGIGFRRPATMTSERTFFELIGDMSTGLLVEDCEFDGLNCNLATGEMEDGLIVRQQSTTRADGIIFRRTTFKNISMEAQNYNTLFRFGANEPGQFYDCDFEDITVTNKGTEIAGAIHFESGSGGVVHRCNFRRWNLNSAVNGVHRTIVYANAVVMDIKDVRFEDVTYTAEQYSGGICMYLGQESDVQRVHGENLTLNATNYLGDGGMIYQTEGAGASNPKTKFRDITGRNINTRSGGLVFCSNGASLDAQRVRLTDSKVDVGGALYVGFNGDADIASVYVRRVSQLTSNQNHGKGVFLRINPSVSGGDVRNVTYRLANLDIRDCDSDEGFTKGIEIQNSHASAETTADIYNAICRNGGGAGEEIRANGTGTMTVTTHSCNVEGGATATEGTTDNDLTSADPGGAEDGKVTGEFRRNGARFTALGQYLDITGEPFPSWDISIGAIQSKEVPSHPVNV